MDHTHEEGHKAQSYLSSAEGGSSMYAIVETGGKQYRVEPGQTVRVELLHAEKGEIVDLAPVFLVTKEEGPLIGTPTVTGAMVSA